MTFGGVGQRDIHGAMERIEVAEVISTHDVAFFYL